MKKKLVVCSAISAMVGVLIGVFFFLKEKGIIKTKSYTCPRGDDYTDGDYTSEFLRSRKVE